jgi:hypothetical protein
MINYRVRWTTPAGEEKTSAAAYDAVSAEQRQTALRAEGHQDVEVFQVVPGQ